MESETNIDIRVGVKNKNQPGQTTPRPGQVAPGAPGAIGAPGAPNTGMLANTGVSIFSIVMLILIICSCAGIIIYQSRKGSSKLSLKKRRVYSSVVVVLGLLAAGAFLSKNPLAFASPTLSVSPSTSAMNLEVNNDGQASSAVNNTITMSAPSSTGYKLVAKLDRGNLPQGVKVSIRGGLINQDTELTTQERQIQSSPAASVGQSVPISLKVEADSSVIPGDYQAKVAVSVKTLPDQTIAHEFATITELMDKDGLSEGQAVKITNFHANDQVDMIYIVKNGLPADPVLNRIAVPLKAGKYAVPQALNTQLPAENSPEKIEQFMGVAQTYVNAGTDLQWNSNKSTPLYTSDPNVVRGAGKPYGITCSAFVNMVQAAWRYEDTLYVKPTNMASYSWGTKFQRPAGTPGPFGANNSARWMEWQDRIAIHTPGVEDYKRGDILYFAKQDPEGPGTGGKFFMNVYHNAIYMGNNKVVHSYGVASGAGVVIENFSDSLKKDLVFIGRPNLNN